jgi:deoxyribodipyrimidine photo-lyase
VAKPVLIICLFKRDLRVADHAALAAAAERCRSLTQAGTPARLLCLYCYEPTVLADPNHDACHTAFVNGCLRELRAGLRAAGSELFIRHADLPAALEEFASEHTIDAVHAHQETGLGVTYARDRAIIDWCNRRSISFCEHRQHGVVRRLRSRDGWARRWQTLMDTPLIEPPRELPPPPPGVRAGAITQPERLGIGASRRDLAQQGGASVGAAFLESFLAERSVTYRTAMSSPVSAFDACSRLSPYLAFGALSLRSVHQQTRQRLAQADEPDQRDRARSQSLQSFSKRLRWHCHFMQKLEDEPGIEHRNFSRAYDGLRTEDLRDWSDEDHRRFEAWHTGMTGYPMIDACMRCLERTGWINFRMRAMLVSFASYHLWLHWKHTAPVLARRFVDFEPGIHYAQFQMQSGTTGINTVRIYSPIKQVTDHDPAGAFIRRWVPELAEVPDEHIAEPHKMPPMTQHMAGVSIGDDYPEPIVDHTTAYRAAKDRIYALRRSGKARTEADRVQQRHGSRRRPSHSWR